MTSPPIESNVASVRAPSLSIESALWFLLGSAALLWRFLLLGGSPLAEGEAMNALAAYHWVNGQPYSLSAGLLSPLLVNLNALGFATLGDSDGMARLASAVAGVGLVLSPWLLRPLLGRSAMLGAAFLLLLSPSVAFFSRHNSSDMVAALAAMLLLAGVARWQLWGKRRDALLAALALGVGLTSGAGFWSFLVAGIIFLLWQRNRRSEDDVTSGVWPSTSVTLPLAVIAALSFVVASSAGFLNLPGIGAAFALPVAWFRSLLGIGTPGLALPFFLSFLLYEFLIVACSLIMILPMYRRFPHWTIFLLGWAAVTLIPATLANSGWSGAMLGVTVPLALLGGDAWSQLITAVYRQRLALHLTIVLTLFLLGYTVILLPTLFDGGWIDWARLIILLVLALVVVSGIDHFSGHQLAISVFSLALIVSLAVISFGSAWGLSMVRSADPREPLVVAPTHNDMRRVAHEITGLSLERYRDKTAIPVEIDPAFNAAVRWYLRGFNDGAATPNAGQSAEVMLRPATAPVPTGFIGERFWSGASWSWGSLLNNDILRWMTTREGRNISPTYHEGRLYVQLEDGS